MSKFNILYSLEDRRIQNIFGVGILFKGSIIEKIIHSRSVRIQIDII